MENNILNIERVNTMDKYGHEDSDYIFIFNRNFEGIEIVKNICNKNDFEINDYCYEYLNSAFDYLLEELFNSNDKKSILEIKDELAFDFIQANLDVYNYELKKWFFSIGWNYVDMVLDSCHTNKNTFDLLSNAQETHLLEIWLLACDILEELRKNKMLKATIKK